MKYQKVFTPKQAGIIFSNGMFKMSFSLLIFVNK